MSLSTSTLFHHNSTIPPWHWQEGPNTRGTWDIISSCVITLALCLWTALHLNIPEHNGAMTQRWRKLGWLFTGLLAPEMVVFAALEQRRAAIQVTKEMQARFGQKPKSEWPKLLRWLRPKKRSLSTSEDTAPSELESHTTDRRHQWTHVHSFYALMGGFAFDTSAAPAQFLLDQTTRLTLLPQGLHYMARHAPSLIPDISEEDIRDKSKANGLAKVLVCLQAIWFCVQCVVRVAQSQDISFLELNTFAHAVCVLLTYALWWHKPLDIESPSLMVGEEAWEICALMYVTSNGETTLNTEVSKFFFRRQFSRYSENQHETELSRGQKYGDRVIARWADIFNGRHLAKLQEHQYQARAILRWDPVPESANQNPSFTAGRLDIRSHSQISEAVQVRKGDTVFGFRCIDVYTQADWCRAFPVPEDLWVSPAYNGYRYAREVPFDIHKEAKYQKRVMEGQVRDHESINVECTFQPLDLSRWELVSRAWQKYRPIAQEYDPSIETSKAGLMNGIGRRIGNWPSKLFSFWDGYLTLDIRFLTFSIAAVLYGGLHLLAWEAPFGSSAKQFLWRASGLLLVMSGPVLLLDFPLTLTIGWQNFFEEKIYESLTFLATGVFILLEFCSVVTFVAPLTLILGGFVMAYIPARIFLIVECCLQLGRLPPGAYMTPDWSKYFPHIT